MSNIYTHFKCEHCGHEPKENYVSFGHNEKAFDWTYICTECNGENTIHVQPCPKGTTLLNGSPEPMPREEKYPNEEERIDEEPVPRLI